MAEAPRESLHSPSELLHLAHPWHGLAPGDEAPERVTVYVEMVPTDTVKYQTWPAAPGGAPAPSACDNR